MIYYLNHIAFECQIQYYLSILPFFFHQNLIMALALVHRALVTDTHAVVPAEDDQRLLVPLTDLLWLRVDGGSCAHICLGWTVWGGHLRYHRQRHVAIQLRPCVKVFFTERTVEVSVLPIPEFGDAGLAEGVTARDGHGVFKWIQADRALHMIIHNLSGNLKLQNTWSNSVNVIVNDSRKLLLGHVVTERHIQ